MNIRFYENSGGQPYIPLIEFGANPIQTELESKMTLRTTIAAGLVAMTALTAVPASATGLSIEFGYAGVEQRGGWDRDRGRHGWSHRPDRQHFLSTQEVRRILRSRGYRAIEYLDRQGAIYQAQASREGRRYGLVVSARDGDILNRYRLHR